MFLRAVQSDPVKLARKIFDDVFKNGGFHSRSVLPAGCEMGSSVNFALRFIQRLIPVAFSCRANVEVAHTSLPAMLLCSRSRCFQIFLLRSSFRFPAFISSSFPPSSSRALPSWPRLPSSLFSSVRTRLHARFETERNFPFLSHCIFFIYYSFLCCTRRATTRS